MDIVFSIFLYPPVTREVERGFTRATLGRAWMPLAFAFACPEAGK